jgi:branched-chain amino acid transport system ATP-binding protein
METPGNVVLEVRGITVQFGGLKALDNVSLTLSGQELKAIIGPNGAGKTTLFNAITGEVKAAAGAVVLRGRNVTGVAPYRAHRLGISRAFQTPKIFPALSVGENLWLATDEGKRQRWNPFINAASSAKASPKVAELADTVGLEGKLGALAGELSHADQKLLDIAIAYASNPAVLLLDEPTQGVSPEELNRITAVIKERIHGASVLLIEHNMSTVFELATSVAVLDRGILIADGSPASVAENPEVQAAYLGTAVSDIRSSADPEKEGNGSST